jgi:(E)-4-hydroxy-3-methylbut-2-enyl-diphosphate synthase
MAEQRRLLFELIEKEVKNPVIIKRDYKNISRDDLRLYSSTDLGSLLIDGFGDGVWITSDDQEKSINTDNHSTKFVAAESKEKFINRTLFGILQAARVRISKTEYIACPSCGRTLFDLQETTDKIRKRTEHLKGVKIAVMGCIVNGPGEMADADYGYVGSGVDKITLYRNKDVVKRGIPSKDAVDELIELIKEDGKWVNLD